MAKRTTLVSARTIREAFQSGDLNVADVLDAKGNAVNPASILGKNGDGKVRGRLHPAFAAHYVERHKGTAYKEKSTAEVRQRDLTYKVKDKAGRARNRTVTLPVSEVRVLAGKEGTRGRLGKADLEKAAQAYAASKAKASQ